MKKCKTCENEFKNKYKKHIYCSKECSDKARIKGAHIASRGYRLVFEPNHPMATKAGYVPEHRLVVMNILGRMLEKDEIVHHINGNKLDNRFDNLQIISRHDIGKAEKLNTECPKCHHRYRIA